MMQRKAENSFLKKELQVKDKLIMTLVAFIAKQKVKLPPELIAMLEKLYPEKKDNGN